MATAVHVRNVSVVIGKTTILNRLSFSLPAGKLVGLVGPSGSGKTTLIRTILGLQTPTGGSVTLLGYPPGAPLLRHLVGYVTQAPSTYADLSVQENVNYFAALLGASKYSVQEVLEQVELTNHAHQLVGTLSGGQRARVSLAVALLGRPQLLLLDEPTVGLDPLLRKKLWDLFRGLRANGVTIIISSHAMDEAVQCDELLFIRGGTLLAHGAPDDIIKRTHSHNLETAFVALASNMHKSGDTAKTAQKRRAA